MVLNNVILVSQLAGYVIAFILSIFISVPMTIHQDEFRGHCLLFSTGEWLRDTGQFSVNWASQAYCNYTIFVGLFTTLLSAIHIYSIAVHIHKGTDRNFLMAFIDVIEGVLICIMMLIAACFITFGLYIWCKNMTMRFPACHIASGQDIDKQDGINTSNFYILLAVAQFGVWASMTCWVGISVMAFVKIFQQHEIRNLRVSMLRERQRLITEGD